DVDGNEYIDYVCTWGPAILGHAHPKIIAAVKAAAEHGTSFGIPNPFEVTMAKLICSLVPGVQKVRMCNSGTEACMSAIRLARGFTRRDKIIKFDGCYHGHVDSLLVKAAFDANKKQIAGIILEPVPGNAGVYLPKPGYLEFLRKITEASGALLIFDEVMTGFRLARGGAQERFGITADLSTFGKIIGGGLPVGAFGGRADIMDLLAPVGPVYQAGTLSGNPVAMAAGIAALEELGAALTPTLSRPTGEGESSSRGEHVARRTKSGRGSKAVPSPGGEGQGEGGRANLKSEIRNTKSANAYLRLEKLGAQLETEIKGAAKSARVPVTFNRCGSMFCVYFTSGPVWSLAEAMKSDRDRFKKYFHGMLDEGVYLAPSQ